MLKLNQGAEFAQLHIPEQLDKEVAQLLRNIFSKPGYPVLDLVSNRLYAKHLNFFVINSDKRVLKRKLTLALPTTAMRQRDVGKQSQREVYLDLRFSIALVMPYEVSKEELAQAELFPVFGIEFWKEVKEKGVDAFKLKKGYFKHQIIKQLKELKYPTNTGKKVDWRYPEACHEVIEFVDEALTKYFRKLHQALVREQALQAQVGMFLTNSGQDAGISQQASSTAASSTLSLHDDVSSKTCSAKAGSTKSGSAKKGSAKTLRVRSFSTESVYCALVLEKLGLLDALFRELRDGKLVSLIIDEVSRLVFNPSATTAEYAEWTLSFAQGPFSARANSRTGAAKASAKSSSAAATAPNQALVRQLTKGLLDACLTSSIVDDSGEADFVQLVTNLFTKVSQAKPYYIPTEASEQTKHKAKLEQDRALLRNQRAAKLTPEQNSACYAQAMAMAPELLKVPPLPRRSGAGRPTPEQAAQLEQERLEHAAQVAQIKQHNKQRKQFIREKYVELQKQARQRIKQELTQVALSLETQNQAQLPAQNPGQTYARPELIAYGTELDAFHSQTKLTHSLGFSGISAFAQEQASKQELNQSQQRQNLCKLVPTAEIPQLTQVFSELTGPHCWKYIEPQSKLLAKAVEATMTDKVTQGHQLTYVYIVDPQNRLQTEEFIMQLLAQAESFNKQLKQQLQQQQEESSLSVPELKLLLGLKLDTKQGKTEVVLDLGSLLQAQAEQTLTWYQVVHSAKADPIKVATSAYLAQHPNFSDLDYWQSSLFPEGKQAPTCISTNQTVSQCTSQIADQTTSQSTTQTTSQTTQSKPRRKRKSATLSTLVELAEPAVAQGLRQLAFTVLRFLSLRVRWVKSNPELTLYDGSLDKAISEVRDELNGHFSSPSSLISALAKQSLRLVPKEQGNKVTYELTLTTTDNLKLARLLLGLPELTADFIPGYVRAIQNYLAATPTKRDLAQLDVQLDLESDLDVG